MKVENCGVGDPITREQIVTFLYRYAKYKGYDTSYTSDREKTVSTQYTDYKMVSQPAFTTIIDAKNTQNHGCFFFIKMLYAIKDSNEHAAAIMYIIDIDFSQKF